MMKIHHKKKKINKKIIIIMNKGYGPYEKIDMIENKVSCKL